MSQALSTAIYARLAGTEVLTGDALTAQESLEALLETDPVTSAPAVFYGNYNRSQLRSSSTGVRTPVVPCVTFRQGGGIVDRGFVTQTGAVDRVYYDFEFWAGGDSPLTIAQIAEEVEQLLDLRRGVASMLTLSSGYLFHSQASTVLNTLYDPSLHIWAGLVTYVFTECRF